MNQRLEATVAHLYCERYGEESLERAEDGIRATAGRRRTAGGGRFASSAGEDDSLAVCLAAWMPFVWRIATRNEGCLWTRFSASLPSSKAARPTGRL